MTEEGGQGRRKNAYYDLHRMVYKNFPSLLKIPAVASANAQTSCADLLSAVRGAVPGTDAAGGPLAGASEEIKRATWMQLAVAVVILTL